MLQKKPTKKSLPLAPSGIVHTVAPPADANAETTVSMCSGGWGDGGAVWMGDASRVMYGESVPSGGIPSGKPVAVALMNFAKATTRRGEDQMGDAGSSDGTARRKRCLAQSRGGHLRTACVKDSSSEEHLGQVGMTGSLDQAGLWATK